LLITGGGWPLVGKDAARIDTLREFADSHQPPMLTARRNHPAVYHAQFLYVLGGWNDWSRLKECERYVCAESRWEALPPLPIACSQMSGVVVEGSLYALGGYDADGALDSIHKLGLKDLTWMTIDLKLPYTGCFSCFKISDAEVYLVMNKTPFSFTPLQVLPLKPLSEDIQSWRGPSFYSRGTVYSSNHCGVAKRLEIGSLN
jgi:hypothetical protein